MKPIARPHSTFVFSLGIGGVIALFFLNVFSTIPFLQHEIIGPAFWWTDPGSDFLKILFDGEKMDGGPGRFRYLEYLSQAAYWKLMASGYLPKNVYDYFGFLSVFISGYFLYRAGRIRGLTHLEIFACLSFFVLSTHTFLVSVFHYRKARLIFAILLALLLWVSESKTKMRASYSIISIIGFLGFFSDPYFIATVPILVFWMDYSEKKIKRFLFLILGMSTAFLLMLLLNGVIGPIFNSNTQLLFRSFSSQEAIELLNLKNIPAFPRILKELLIPGFVTEPVWAWEREMFNPGIFTESSWIGWALLFFFISFGILQFRNRARGWGLTLGFVTILPICSYLLIPISTRSTYSGYYGYPYLVLLTVLLMNLLTYFRTFHKGVIYRCSLLSILVFTSFHQCNFREVYEHWVEHYLFPIRKELYTNDYSKLTEINQYLSDSTVQPYQLNRISRRTKSNLGLGWYASSDQSWTDLVDIIIPIIFRNEIKNGRIQINGGTQPLKPNPSHILWSDTLRYPYHLGPVAKGTVVDIRWNSSHMKKCRLDPFGATDLEGGVRFLKVEGPSTITLVCEGSYGMQADAFTINTL